MRCCILHRKMAAKNGGKPTFGESGQQTLPIPLGLKFRRNCSSSLRFRDKHVFAFYAEIQDGHQKWRAKDFLGKSPVDSADTLWIKNFVKIVLAHSVSEINTLFIEIALARSISKINACLRIKQKFN